MARPVRLQLSRKKGFDLQEHSRSVNGLPAVNVARPTKWGNPFTIAAAEDVGYSDPRSVAVKAFRDWLHGDNWACGCLTSYRRERKAINTGLHELTGKNLACWCKPGDPCHADVLLDLANPLPEGKE